MEDHALDVEAILTDALTQESESWAKDMKIWPSDLGLALGPEHDGCPVSFWHDCRNAERKPIPPGVMLMFRIGDLVEQYLIELLEKYGPAHGWEVVSSQERAEAFGISGRSDVILRHIESGYTVVVDVKSKRGNAFQYLNDPKPGNVLQVQHYIAGHDADAGGLLYADREGQNFVKFFDIPRQDERPEKAVQVLEEIRDADAPPPTIPLRLARRKNKGADSLYLNVPWQITWCKLKDCACAKALPGSVPDKIVAKVGNDGTVTPEKGYEKWFPLVLKLLREEYPDETFLVDGELFDD